jgi:hypothetical protein
LVFEIKHTHSFFQIILEMPLVNIAIDYTNQ